MNKKSMIRKELIENQSFGVIIKLKRLPNWLKQVAEEYQGLVEVLKTPEEKIEGFVIFLDDQKRRPFLKKVLSYCY